MSDLFSPVVDVTEAARMLGVSGETIRRWRRLGRLVAIEDRGARGAWRFRRVEIEDRMVALGKIRPRYQIGSDVIYRGGLARVEAYRPSKGYLLYTGGGSDWAPEHALEPARPR